MTYTNAATPRNKNALSTFRVEELRRRADRLLSLIDDMADWLNSDRDANEMVEALQEVTGMVHDARSDRTIGVLFALAGATAQMRR
jgi:hypothetical protein